MPCRLACALGAEWTTLTEFLGGESVAGGKILIRLFLNEFQLKKSTIMKTMKYLLSICVCTCLAAGTAFSQSNKATECRTESGHWYFNCVDEYLDGDITFCLTRWVFKSQHHFSYKLKGSLVGTDSGDTYTISSSEKLRLKELGNGITYVKSYIFSFSIYRNGEFWAVAHVNTLNTFNAKGEWIVHVDHRIDCD